MAVTGLFSGVVIIFALFSVCFADSNNSCITPRNQNGECKVINKCSNILAILQNRPISSQNADYLKRSLCGFEGNLQKVCCPLESQTTTTSTPQVNHVAGKPADSPLLPTTQVCGIEVPDKIYGGKIAGLNEFPWMALIEYERSANQRDFHCGGVLINSRYVLTAAHCIKNKDPKKTWKLVSVRLGEYNIENKTDCIKKDIFERCAPPPLDVPVEEAIPHEEFSAFDINRYHDVALLRLAREVPFSVYVKPICLPTTELIQSKTTAGEKVWVAGWGRTENGTQSPVKLKLLVLVSDPTNCSLTYRYEAGVNLHGTQLCAGGEKGKDSCGGDSGGPLMGNYANLKQEINWYSIGIVSFGSATCGKEGWPGVYTKVADYMPWIVSKLRP